MNCGDWNSDDQPYPMKVRRGRMFSIPYCMEINDIPLIIRKEHERVWFATGSEIIDAYRRATA